MRCDLADSLRAELLAIEGIASAELEGSADAPQGVRVQLAAGADAESVGLEVQRVLASHGMRSHRAAGAAAPDTGTGTRETATSPEPAAVAGGDESAQPGPPPPPGASDDGDAAVLPMRGMAGGTGQVVTDIRVEPTRQELESVSVEESRAGISVRVMAGGKAATRQVGAGPEAIDAAIVGALTEVLDHDAELLAVQRGDTGGARIVTVLLEEPGEGRKVGSAVVASGEAYAVALAAWRALRAPE